MRDSVPNHPPAARANPVRATNSPTANSLSLATWLYYFMPGIHELRLDLARGLIEYARDLLEREEQTVHRDLEISCRT